MTWFCSFRVFNKQVLMCSVSLVVPVGSGRFCSSWDPSTQEILPSFRTFTYEPNGLWTRTDNEATRVKASYFKQDSCGLVQRGGGGDWYGQRRSEGRALQSSHPRFSKGGQGKEVRWKYSILVACHLTHSWRNPGQTLHTNLLYVSPLIVINAWVSSPDPVCLKSVRIGPQ